MESKVLKFIYGAGKYGKLLFHCFSDLMEIDYFVQTEEPIVNEIEGIPVISFERIINMKGKKIIFLAISDKRIAEEIERNIYSADNENITVYYCGNFVADNCLMRIKPHPTGDKHCIVCGYNFEKFLSGGINAEIFSKHHIIGGGYRNSYRCPCCGATDRVRWGYYVLQNKTDILEISGRVLHIAPERGIKNLIERNREIDYYTADIVSGKAMHVTDITDIQYKDGTFDYIICNHVMEHIADEEKAVNEIKRVLKENGRWIFSFPICKDMITYEDPSILTPEARLEAYGQHDHVRLYGNDYKNRFEKYGFNLQIFSPEREVNIIDIEKYGFIKDDVIIMATKIST